MYNFRIMLNAVLMFQKYPSGPKKQTCNTFESNALQALYKALINSLCADGLRVCVCLCVRACVPCVVSADVTAGTALSRGVSKSWDSSSGERERERERERGGRERERESDRERE